MKPPDNVPVDLVLAKAVSASVDSDAILPISSFFPADVKQLPGIMRQLGGAGVDGWGVGAGGGVALGAPLPIN